MSVWKQQGKTAFVLRASSQSPGPHETWPVQEPYTTVVEENSVTGLMWGTQVRRSYPKVLSKALILLANTTISTYVLFP